MPISKGTLLIRGFLEARKHMERIVLQAAQLSHFSPVKIFTGTLCLLKQNNSFCFGLRMYGNVGIVASGSP